MTVSYVTWAKSWLEKRARVAAAEKGSDLGFIDCFQTELEKSLDQKCERNKWERI